MFWGPSTCVRYLCTYLLYPLGTIFVTRYVAPHQRKTAKINRYLHLHKPLCRDRPTFPFSKSKHHLLPAVCAALPLLENSEFRHVTNKIVPSGVERGNLRKTKNEKIALLPHGSTHTSMLRSFHLPSPPLFLPASG